MMIGIIKHAENQNNNIFEAWTIDIIALVENSKNL